MSLKVWLPLNGNIKNRGCSNVIATNSGATISSDGKIGQCYNFDDGTGTGKGISLNTNFISSNNLGNNFSIAVWVNPHGNHIHYNGTILSSGNWNNQCWAFGLKQDNSAVDVFGNGYNKYLTCAVPTNTWTHLVCINENGTCKVYKNGIYVGSTTDSSLSVSDATNTFIGRETYAGGYFGFNGDLNDLRIYDHCLSLAEIHELNKCLVLHYKLDDPYIENTTNINNYISQGIDNTCYNGATGKYSYGTTTDIYKTTGYFQGKNCTKVYMGTAGLTANPFVHFSNIHPGNGSYKTLSFDYFPTSCSSICFYTHGGSATCQYSINGSAYATYTASQSIPVNLNQWNHVILVLYGTSDKTSGWGYMPIGSHTSTTTDYWLFANVQIEEKDHATPYTSSSRTSSIVFDNSGFGNDGTIVGSLNVYPDSYRYSKSTYLNNYNTTTNYIEYSNTLSFLSAGSCSFWAKIDKAGSSGWLPVNGQDGSHYFMATSGGTGSFYHQNAGSGQTIYVDGVVATKPATDGGWHHYCITNINISTWTKMKLNDYGSSWDSNLHMSDFRLYNTVLSADDVKELYTTSAKISKNGTLMCYEIKEN